MSDGYRTDGKNYRDNIFEIHEVDFLPVARTARPHSVRSTLLSGKLERR